MAIDLKMFCGIFHTSFFKAASEKWFLIEVAGDSYICSSYFKLNHPPNTLLGFHKEDLLNIFMFKILDQK